MAGVVQWSIDQFWGQLQALKSQIDQADAALQADKLALQNAYTALNRNYDPSADQFVAPLIHQNTVLRLNYLAPVKQKFTEAVNAASAALKSAGYTTPNLSGLGIVPVVPVVAITAVLVALAAVAIVWRLTQAQVARTNAMLAVYSDPSTTPDQKAALGQSMTDQIKAQNKATPPPLGFNFNDLLPIAAVVAVIVLGPQILRMLPSRRATA